MTETLPQTKKLEGKAAIITGGASGIGEATARVFARHGAHAIVIADIRDDLGQQVATSIGTDKCKYMHCDVSNEDQVKTLVDSTLQTYDRLDIMFSNAGIFIGSDSDQTVLDIDLSGFDRLFAVNVRGMAACVKYAGRAMVERGVRGSIVCTASVVASRASAQLGAYGIRVNSVSPYAVATPGVCSAHGMEVEKIEKFYEAYTSLKGIVLKGKHVGDVVLFLASEDSEFVTGHDLVVDGGFFSRMSF
ncbi:hypothetical protein Pint_15274 [Pistacia integerrima]|uniref:Uncharacterized protein n=1 Tax=Pistacia integerrima TaxID=434235 RepID=A0ACC0ZE24_9ROSI|nr:hypothetical protein Pint_15274 [Pistacia integerrima]